jgi:hypothetical protein
MKTGFPGTDCVRLVFCLGLLTLGSTLASAQTTSLPQKDLRPSSLAPGDNTLTSFGTSVSILGGRAIVGTPARTATGEVFIFEQSGGQWVEKQRIDTPQGDPERGQGMGFLLAQDDNSFVSADSTYGFVYYFEKSSPTAPFRATAILNASTAYWDFGTSLAMSGCFIAVGSGTRYYTPAQAGAVHMFNRCITPGRLTYTGSFRSPDAAAGDLFSSSMALFGNELLVGSPNLNGSSGATYYYTYNGSTWVLKQKLLQTQGANGNRFGAAVAFRNGLAVIGSPGKPDVGQAELFKKGSNGVWTSLGELVPPTSDGTWGSFGRQITVTPDRVVVGAVPDWTSPGLKGAVFVYRRTGDALTLETQLTASAPDTAFGSSISVAGRGLIVGEPERTRTDGFSKGGATIYQLLP